MHVSVLYFILVLTTLHHYKELQEIITISLKQMVHKDPQTVSEIYCQIFKIFHILAVKIKKNIQYSVQIPSHQDYFFAMFTLVAV